MLSAASLSFLDLSTTFSRSSGCLIHFCARERLVWRHVLRNMVDVLNRAAAFLDETGTAARRARAVSLHERKRASKKR